MTMLFGRIDMDSIRMMSRWHSYAMMRYIHIQAQPIFNNYAAWMYTKEHMPSFLMRWFLLSTLMVMTKSEREGSPPPTLHTWYLGSRPARAAAKLARFSNLVQI
jgi:hypothetical protein